MKGIRVFMKKISFKKGRINRIIVLIIIVIIILLTIIIVNSNKKYTNLEIKELLVNGFNSMENFYVEDIDVKNNELIRKIYIKDNIKKIQTVEDEGKSYLLIDLKYQTINCVYIKEKKIVDYTNVYSSYKKEDLKYLPFLNFEDFSENNNYIFIKQEKFHNKKCIVVKREKSLDDRCDYYWIEKKTGYIIGYGDLDINTNEIVESFYFDNFKIGELKDSDLKIPSDYVKIN